MWGITWDVQHLEKLVSKTPKPQQHIQNQDTTHAKKETEL